MITNPEYNDILYSKDTYWIDEIVIFTNMYKINEHSLRKNIREIIIYDDNNKIYEYDLIDDLLFVSNDNNNKLYIKIINNKK